MGGWSSPGSGKTLQTKISHAGFFAAAPSPPLPVHMAHKTSNALCSTVKHKTESMSVGVGCVKVHRVMNVCV